jgi:hypothetical protein
MLVNLVNSSDSELELYVQSETTISKTNPIIEFHVADPNEYFDYNDVSHIQSESSFSGIMFSGDQWSPMHSPSGGETWSFYRYTSGDVELPEHYLFTAALRLNSGSIVWNNQHTGRYDFSTNNADPRYGVPIWSFRYHGDTASVTWDTAGSYTDFPKYAMNVQSDPPAFRGFITVSTDPANGSVVNDGQAFTLCLTNTQDSPWKFSQYTWIGLVGDSLDNFVVSGTDDNGHVFVSDDGSTAWVKISPKDGSISGRHTIHFKVASVRWKDVIGSTYTWLDTPELNFEYQESVAEYVPAIPDSEGSSVTITSTLPHESVMSDLDVIYNYLTKNVTALTGLSAATLASTVASAVIASLSQSGYRPYKPTVVV